MILIDFFATIWRVRQGFLSLCQDPVKDLLGYKSFSEIMLEFSFPKLDYLIRLSQKGSYSVVAALQMWRIESSLIPSADLIGVKNPEKKVLTL